MHVETPTSRTVHPVSANAQFLNGAKRIGEVLAGYAFDSIGRCGKGALLRERFIPEVA